MPTLNVRHLCTEMGKLLFACSTTWSNAHSDSEFADFGARKVGVVRLPYMQLPSFRGGLGRMPWRILSRVHRIDIFKRRVHFFRFLRHVIGAWGGRVRGVITLS